jgi:hypothetical protein
VDGRRGAGRLELPARAQLVAVGVEPDPDLAEALGQRRVVERVVGALPLDRAAEQQQVPHG